MRLLLAVEGHDVARGIARLLDAAPEAWLLDHAATAAAAARLLAAGHHEVALVEEAFFGDPALLQAVTAAQIPLIALLDDAPGREDAALDAAVACLGRTAMDARALALTLRGARQETRRRRAAQEQQRLFDLAQEAAGLGTWTWDLATQAVTWSRGLFRLFGVRPEDAHPDLFAQWRAQLHPEDLDAAQAAAVAAIADQAPLDSTFRIHRPAPAGGHPELRWIHCRGEIVRDAEGRPLRVIGINLDVTETQHALQAMAAGRQAALREAHRSETRFRTYFDISPDCMFHVRAEADGRFTYEAVNAAGLAATGLAFTDMQGRTPEQVLGPEKGPQMTQALRAALRGGEPHRYEASWTLPGGSVTYDAVYVPLRNAAGAVTGILGIARDVTERRRLEASLHQAQKSEALGQLAGGIAHDFNNLLAGFDAALNLLGDEVASLEGKHVAAEGLRSVERGKALTDWLLGFAREQPLAVAAVDLTPVLENVEHVVLRSLGLGIRISKVLAPGLWRARADVNQFELAMLNLAINARDAMPMGGVLTFASRNETIRQPQPDGLLPGDYVVVDVSDTGRGMPPEVLARALEAFFTTKEAGQGTGLGLSMVAGIARRFGGGLRLVSSLGAGTMVSVFFPRAPGDGASRQDAAPAGAKAC